MTQCLSPPPSPVVLGSIGAALAPQILRGQPGVQAVQGAGVVVVWGRAGGQGLDFSQILL